VECFGCLELFKKVHPDSDELNERAYSDIEYIEKRNFGGFGGFTKSAKMIFNANCKKYFFRRSKSQVP